MEEIMTSTKTSSPAKLQQITIALVFALMTAGATSTATGAEKLTLDTYLDQVRNRHLGYKGNKEASEGGELRSEEGRLQLSPTAFANYLYKNDTSQLSQLAFINFDAFRTHVASFGISQATTIGLSGKLSYNFYSSHYANPNSSLLTPAAAATLSQPWYNQNATLELSQSLWSNGFGRGVRAQQTVLEASALTSSFANSFLAKTTLTQAEAAYWRLAAARQILKLQQEARERAQKIYDLNARKAKMQLADRADVLQSEAQLEARTNDVQSAQEEIRAASRAFNSARNSTEDEVPEELADLDPQTIDELKIPQRAKYRDDVKAAEQAQRANMASAEVAIERDRPTLDIVGSIAGIGQGYDLGTVTGSSLVPLGMQSSSEHAETIGLRFSAPLNFGLLSKSKEGWVREREAAELNYQRKLFDQEQDWNDLNQRLADARKRLTRAQRLEQLQQTKLNYERDRLSRGRTTTFQVLIFETEYLIAQLVRVREHAVILSLIAQMKLYTEDSPTQEKSS